MQQLTTIPRTATSRPALDAAGPPKTVTNRLTLSIAADSGTTQRALDQLDLFGPAIRAMRALGLTDRVTLTPRGISWRPDRRSGRIHLAVDVRVAPDHEGGSSLTIITRCSATDERTHERLLDAWPVLGPLAATLVKRAAHTVKHLAEQDQFEPVGAIEDGAIAA